MLIMVYLPPVALATILGMNPFFSQSPDNPHSVGWSDFWIFGAIATPVTLLILICYIIWVHREWM